MCKVFICQIVDSLSEKITHTFMASNYDHAVRQFHDFLMSLKGKIHFDDFTLICPCCCTEIPETYDEAFGFSCANPNDSFRGDEVMKDEA